MLFRSVIGHGDSRHFQFGRDLHELIDFARPIEQGIIRVAVQMDEGHDWLLVFALKLLFGEMSEILLASQRVLPAAAEAAGFKFRFPELGGALEDLLGK